MALCEICDALDIDAKSRLGEYSELLSRADAGCDACKFYCDILQSSNHWSHQLDKLPGHIVFLHNKRLDVRKPEREDGSSWSCDDLLFDYVVPEDYTGPKDEETDSRRIIPPNPEDEACFDQLRSWLSECSEHQDCPKSKQVPLPTRVLEVSPDLEVAPKLILSEGRKGEYVILSHASDDAEEAKLQLPQVGESLEMSSLPKTFSDAVTITRRLGYRYLCISSFCLSQKDTTDRASEMSEFPAIYGQSALMISAARASDLDSGILNPRKVLYSPALGKTKDRFMRQKLLRWDWDLKHPSSTSPQGWSALERILAPRIVHYTKRQMIWECADGLKFEASGIPDKITGRGQVRMNYKKKFVQPFITAYLDRHLVSTSPTVDANKISNRLEAWYQTIDELSNHTFPRPTDVVLATSCIAQILSHDQKLGSYISGLWTSNLAAGLTWGRVYPVLTAAPIYRAPTWSPLSVDGETSSLFLSWSEAMLQDQLSGPGLEFVSRYGPKLISQDVTLVDEKKPYGAVKQGSNISISGSVVGLMKLLTTVNEDDDDTFHPTFVLDKSWALDCSECGRHEEKFTEEEREKEGEHMQEKLGSYVVLFVQGNFIGGGMEDGVVDCVVLGKPHSHHDHGNAENEEKKEEAEGYERVGFLRLSLDFHYKPIYENEDGTFNRAVVEDKFEGLGWERMDLQLF